MRRQSRELTLQYLFQGEFQIKSGSDLSFRSFAKHFDVPNEVVEYAEQLVSGILAQKEEIDRVIQSASAHWKLSRMSLVDVNVMRIAVFEMLMMNPSLSAGVAINEAVEVAKRYGTSDSGAFVNGLLDKIAQSSAQHRRSE